MTPAAASRENDVRLIVTGSRAIDVWDAAISLPEGRVPARVLHLAVTGERTYEAHGVRFSQPGRWHVTVLGRGGGEVTGFDVNIR